MRLRVHVHSNHVGILASLAAQSVKNPPAMQETRVQSLGWEDPPEKEMATHSSILAWRIPWTKEPRGLQSMGSQELDMTQQLNHHRFSSNIFFLLKDFNISCSVDMVLRNSFSFCVSENIFHQLFALFCFTYLEICFLAQESYCFVIMSLTYKSCKC